MTCMMDQNELETTVIEIESLRDPDLGNVTSQCVVAGCDIRIDHEKMEIICNEYHPIIMDSYSRKKEVNCCKFIIPEKAYCNYVRTIQAKPTVHERKWFRVENGQMIILGDVKGGMSPSFAVEQFFGEYLKTYKVRYGRIPFKPEPES